MDEKREHSTPSVLKQGLKYGKRNKPLKYVYQRSMKISSMEVSMLNVLCEKHPELTINAMIRYCIRHTYETDLDLLNRELIYHESESGRIYGRIKAISKIRDVSQPKSNGETHQ